MSVWLSTRRSTRGEQLDESVKVDGKNDQIAHRRLVAGRKSQECEIAIRQRHLPTLQSKLDGGGIFLFCQDSDDLASARPR